MPAARAHDLATICSHRSDLTYHPHSRLTAMRDPLHLECAF